MIVSATHSNPERRQQKRYSCCGLVKIIHPTLRVTVPATILDISLTGCALRLRQPEWLDKDSTVELNFATSYFAFRVVGSVRSFSPEDLLVRIQFLQLNERGWTDILAFIRDQGDDWTQTLKATQVPAVNAA